MTEPLPKVISNDKASMDRPPSGAWDAFTKFFVDYKEILATIILLSTGILWAFDYFATKKQLTEMRCFVSSNFGVVQGKMDSASLSQILVENLQDTASLKAKAALTPAEELKLNQLEAARNLVVQKLADADHSTAQALSRLTTDGCTAE